MITQEQKERIQKAWEKYNSSGKKINIEFRKKEDMHSCIEGMIKRKRNELRFLCIVLKELGGEVILKWYYNDLDLLLGKDVFQLKG